VDTRYRPTAIACHRCTARTELANNEAEHGKRSVDRQLRLGAKCVVSSRNPRNGNQNATTNILRVLTREPFWNERLAHLTLETDERYRKQSPTAIAADCIDAIGTRPSLERICFWK